MHLAALVIGGRCLTEALLYQFISNNHIIAGRSVDHEFQNIEQLARITAAITEQQRVLPYLDVFLTKLDVLRYGLVKERPEVIFAKLFERVYLAARKQRADHLERRVLSCGSDKGHGTLLHCAEQRVLL